MSAAPGPVEDWPWGQKPAKWMLDPTGHLAGPLRNPEGWMAAHLSSTRREVRTPAEQAAGGAPVVERPARPDKAPPPPSPPSGGTRRRWWRVGRRP